LCCRRAPYVTTGDFVDRGSFSVENVLTLFAFKVLYPTSMFLTRGNHETKNMNKVRLPRCWHVKSGVPIVDT
jgi:hypothetical protein